jgi:two-component system cell cycle sensor histidine kinase/response regulator CckA
MEQSKSFSESLFQTLVDRSTVAIYAIENDRFFWVNTWFADALGYTVEEILALDSVTDIIVDEHRERVQEMIRRREGDEPAVRYAIKARCRDGRVLEIEIHGSVADVGGRRIVIGVAVDVTAQVAASRRVQEREDYFRALTENVSDVITILNREGLISYVSPSVERALQYSPEELVGSSIFERIHPDDRDHVAAAFDRLVAGTSGPSSSMSYRFRRKDGAWRMLESVGTNLLRHPQVSGVVLSTRDVTERQQLEQELEQLHRLTSLGRLAAQVAHEFNNVLMGLQPVVEVIRRRGADDPTMLRFANMASASINRGKRITTDILRFARPAQLTLQPVKVEELIHQVTDEVRPMLPDFTVLEVNAGDASVTVSADQEQLSQALINLALNARDAMLTVGGTLTIGAFPEQRDDLGKRFIHFTVSDSGEGISSDDLPYIFEPLFTTKKSGTGLGLSVVMQIVAAHGGHVSVDSEPGEGTTFHIFIPAVDQIVKRDSIDRQQNADLPKELRLLLVEDDQSVAHGLQWSLEQQGIAVHVVTTGAAASQAVTELQPDVIVLDLNLPDDDGREVYRRLASGSPIAVIFSSGHALPSEITELLDNPHAAFLMKPYSIEDLLRTIREVVASKEVT